MTRRRIPPYVAVVGPADAPDDLCAQAEEVGRLLARRGAVVVTGGLGGVMAAACRGAATSGGRTVGLLPGDDRSAANEWVDVAVATGLGEARNTLVIRTVDAVVAVGGSWGTLAEVALAARAGLPIIGLRTWRVVDAAGNDAGAGPVEAATPAEAVDAVLGAL